MSQFDYKFLYQHMPE